ncbi:CYP51G2 [Arabidopsis thaliana]|uniref:CYP51G2 n=1 Tax=Arabidopsis thaliana TaxID=3702 RepID=A0A178VY72_ARATH|nr:CYP51G2 [Arabidopsis thaliana]
MDWDYYTLLKTSVAIIIVFVVAKLITSSKSKKKTSVVPLPPVLKAWPPFIGSLIRFMKGPIVLLREEYPKLGSVFTVKLLHKNITFLIGPEVSSHFFNAYESELSQKEIYKFNVPTFGPGVVFDVDYPVRMEQFRFFSSALKVNKLRGYVDQMTKETELY